MDDGSSIHTRADLSHPFQSDVGTAKALRGRLIITGSSVDSAQGLDDT